MSSQPDKKIADGKKKKKIALSEFAIGKFPNKVAVGNHRCELKEKYPPCELSDS